MECSEICQLRAPYIARELGDDQIQEVLTHLDHCQSCHEAYLQAIADEVNEILTRGPAATRLLTPEEIEDERIAQTRRTAHADVDHPWPMEDFNYRAFVPAPDPCGGPGWWISSRTRPMERAAWAVTLALPDGPYTELILLLLSLGGLYDWSDRPCLELPVRYRKPPDWYLQAFPRDPLAPIWAVVSVAALLARLHEVHGKMELRRALADARRNWASDGS